MRWAERSRRRNGLKDTSKRCFFEPCDVMCRTSRSSGPILRPDPLEHRGEIPAVGQGQLVYGVVAVDEHRRAAFGPEPLPELRFDQLDLVLEDVLGVGRAEAHEVGLGHALFGGPDPVQDILYKPLLVGIDALHIERGLLLPVRVGRRRGRLVPRFGAGREQRRPQQDCRKTHRGHNRIRKQER